jgi:hypothetical protein
VLTPDWLVRDGALFGELRTVEAMTDNDDRPNDAEFDHIVEQASVQARIMHGMTDDEAFDHIRDVMGGAHLAFGVWHYADNIFEMMTIKGEHLLHNGNEPFSGLPYEAIPCTDYQHALSIQKQFGDGAPL